MTVIKKAIGHADVYDYYNINEELGKGAAARVHTGINKKTGKEVAIKIISKQEMNIKELALLRGELDAMKVC